MSRKELIFLIGILFVLAIGVERVFFSSETETMEVSVQQVEAYDYSYFEDPIISYGTSYQQPYGTPHISPDGRFVVFVAEKETGGYFYHGVLLFDVENKRVKVLGTGYMYGEPAWNTTSVAVALENGIVLYDSGDNTLRKVGEKHKGTYSPSFSPSGEVLVYSSKDGLVATTLATNEERMITTGESDRAVAWVDENNVLLFRDKLNDKENVTKIESLEKFVFSTGEFVSYDFVPQQKMSSFTWLDGHNVAHLVGLNDRMRVDKILDFKKKKTTDLPSIDTEVGSLDVFEDRVLIANGCAISIFSFSGKDEDNFKLPVTDDVTTLCRNVRILPQDRIVYETYNNKTFETNLHLFLILTKEDSVISPNTNFKEYILSPHRDLIVFSVEGGSFSFHKIAIE